MITRAKVNRALKQAFPELEITLEGRDHCFWYSGKDAEYWYDCGAGIYHLNGQYTIEHFVREVAMKLEENVNRKPENF